MKFLILLILATLHGVYTQECKIFNETETKINHRDNILNYHDRFTYFYIICFNIKSVTNRTLQNNTNNGLVNYIAFKDGNIRKISSNAFGLVNNIEELDLNSNKIELVDPQAFNNLIKLQGLYLQNNKIRQLGEASFRSLNSLKVLDLSKNSLTRLGNMVLYDLVNLEELDLSFNSLTTISSPTFNSTRALKILNLNNNRLYDIQSDAFQYLNHLELLLLCDNSIVNLSKYLFDSTIFLHSLDLSNNSLIELKFVSLPSSLKILNISHNNNLSTTNSQLELKNIEIVDLSHNNLTKVLVLDEGVKVFLLNNNYIHILNASTFYNGSDLICLNLSHNKIETIERDIFRTLLKLERLDLSQNNVMQIQIGSFGNLISLSELSLSNNSLMNIEFGTFSGLSNLIALYLDNNSISVIPESSFHVLGNLEILHLSNNLITDLDIEGLLYQLKNITMITLDGNNWQCNSLLYIINILTDYSIKFLNGTQIYVQNVNGIPCSYEAKVEFEAPIGTNKILESLQQRSETDFKNTKFYKYAGQESTNSSIFITFLKQIILTSDF